MPKAKADHARKPRKRPAGPPIGRYEPMLTKTPVPMAVPIAKSWT